ncbi:hypothetical protein HYALB_00008810 [Hymenoscyphus albidus]|uniref:DUF7730 domain-containing protein n=1 Tax=Hymenoscyphus albidus TaxID=595503 RepID=A0A9N9M3F4_9HELO|nr:hypothetical protein HYALB_00008810 [Hymenoscyphus albidus]
MASFMDLSLDTRHRIYAYLHLFRLCPIEFNRPEVYHPPDESSSSASPGWYLCSTIPMKCLYIARKYGGKSTPSVSPDIPDCQCPKLPLLRLLLVSRTFYHDIFKAFYSRNRFAVRIYDARGFESFHVGRHIQGTLTSLLVRLNCWPCPRGHEEAGGDGLQCGICKFDSTNADPAMDITSRAGDDLVHWWRWFAKGLESSIMSKHLNLTLVCDVVDRASGMAVVEPLLTLATLKGCTIRLGRGSNDELSRLAEEYSLRAQALFIKTPGTFPFQRLPEELRLLILSYTHLGDHYLYSRDSHLLKIVNNELVNKITTCCRKCTPTRIDCCCSSTRAAYSSTCECRHIPFALLLVSKQMRADTIRVLHSQNAFEFLQDPIETIHFLQKFPQETLKHIRRIHFHFSETEINNWTKRSYNNKLTQLIQCIKQNLNTTHLSITVILETFDTGGYAEDDEDLQLLYDIYRDITRAFRLLNELEDIQFDVGWFIYLEPIMRRAVLGRAVLMGLLKLKWSYPEGDPPGCFRLPVWYRRGILRGVEGAIEKEVGDVEEFLSWC